MTEGEGGTSRAHQSSGDEEKDHLAATNRKFKTEQTSQVKLQHLKMTFLHHEHQSVTEHHVITNSEWLTACWEKNKSMTHLACSKRGEADINGTDL